MTKAEFEQAESVVVYRQLNDALDKSEAGEAPCTA